MTHILRHSLSALAAIALVLAFGSSAMAEEGRPSAHVAISLGDGGTTSESPTKQSAAKPKKPATNKGADVHILQKQLNAPRANRAIPTPFNIQVD